MNKRDDKGARTAYPHTEVINLIEQSIDERLV